MDSRIRTLKWDPPATPTPAAMHEDIYGHSATVVSGAVWVLGGKTEDGRGMTVHVLRLLDGSWADRSAAGGHRPGRRWGHSACAVGEGVGGPGALLLLVGGFDSCHNLRDTWRLDTEDAAFAQPRLDKELGHYGAYHSLVYDPTDQRAYLFGGQCCVGGPYEYSNDVHVAQLDAGCESANWRKARDLRGARPHARAQHCAALSGGAMIVYGGAAAGRQFNDVWRLDLAQGTWAELAASGTGPGRRPPPVEHEVEEHHFRVHCCRAFATARGGRLLVVARGPGAARWGHLGLHSFDLSSMRWTTLPVESRAPWTGNFAAWVAPGGDARGAGDRVCVLGGHGGGGAQQPRCSLWALPLCSSPPRLVELTLLRAVARGRPAGALSALPDEGMRLVLRFVSGHVLDLL